MLNALNELQITTDILLEALSRNDLDKSHEAISVMLMQGMDFFGPEHPAMQQFFPVWDAIKQHIDSGNVERAVGQTNTWKKQLQEVVEIVKNS
jgi:K+/H+ antiporter YhaU regulatory subunit KhtT